MTDDENRKPGLTDNVLFAVVIIVGIAWCMLWGSLGCSWQVHQRDPLTIAGLDATISAREQDVSDAVRRLAWASTLTARPEDGEALSRAARGLEVRNKAEVERLKAMRWREMQKVEGSNP